MTSLKNLCLGVALLVLGSTSAWATPVIGDFTYGQTGLSFSPSIGNTGYNQYAGTATFTPTLNAANGDFADHTGSFGSPGTNSLQIDGVNGTVDTMISWDFGGFGTFEGTLDPDESPNPNFGSGSLSVNYIGTFTPAFTGHSASNATLSISFTRSGNVTAGYTHNLSGTVTTYGVPPTIPEPATVALAAFGALALGVVARRRA